PVRTLLTLLSIALGVAVVLAIDLAGDAATGSFHSSMQTLAGKNELEVVTGGGVPDEVVGDLAKLPYPLRITARIEDYAVMVDSTKTVPLVGLDLIREAAEHNLPNSVATPDAWKVLNSPESIWTGSSLGLQPGERISLLINDSAKSYVVRGV